MSTKTLKYLLSEQSASQSEHSNCSILPTSGATYILITHSPPMIPNIHQISQLLLSFVKKKSNNNNNSVLYKGFGFVTYYCFTANGLFYWLTLSVALTLHIPIHSGRCPDLFYGKSLGKSCLRSKSQVARVRQKRCSPSRPTFAVTWVDFLKVLRLSFPLCRSLLSQKKRIYSSGYVLVNKFELDL